MARRKQRTKGIALPWENRGTWVRRIFAGSRTRGYLTVGLLVAAVLGLYERVRARDAERVTALAITAVEEALVRFREDVGRCPRSADELVHPPRPGARYLHAMPRDGWGHPLVVRCPGIDDPDDVDVVSSGPDGSFEDADNRP